MIDNAGGPLLGGTPLGGVAPGDLDLAIGVSGTGLLKKDGSNAFAIGTPGTDYLFPAGVALGQTLVGGTGASETLTLKSTAHATKGKIVFGANGISAYDEVNDRLGIGTASPASLTKVHAAAPTGSCIVATEAVTDNTTNLALFQVKSAGNIIGSLAGTGANYTTGANVTIPQNGLVLAANNAGGISLAAIHASGALRFYTGGSAAANLRLTVDAAGVWTLPAYGARATVTGSATTTLTISGLTLDASGNITLRIWVKNATASDATIYIRPNGASTNLAAMVTTQNEAATSTSTTDTGWWSCNLRASSEGWICAQIFCKSGARRRALIHGTSSRNSDQAVLQIVTAGGWNETAPEITSFDIFSTVASALDVGSYVEQVRPNLFLG